MSRCYFIPGLFGRWRKKRDREIQKRKTGGSSGREGKKRGGPGNERPAARVRLIDEFRLEIFATPYAPNRRIPRFTDEKFNHEREKEMTTMMMMMVMMMMMMTTTTGRAKATIQSAKPSLFIGVIAISREIASRCIASGLSNALTSAAVLVPFHYRDRFSLSSFISFSPFLSLALSFVQNVCRYIGTKKFINPRDAA